ncbi:MAG TPA: CAP domain-containing protein [Mucilaginibacter sp.]|jgi:uncharacterized protein YkwD|nr:CAP domain-containing protein [Mucilaginibacter sp.]
MGLKNEGVLKVGAIAFLFLLTVWTACKPSDNIAPVTTNKTTAGSTGNTEGSVATNIDNAALLNLVNGVRASGCTCGTTHMPAVPLLTWNELLAKSALNHSQDMNTTGIFSHDSSDGTSFSSRITAAGYKWHAAGENIAMGQKTEQEVFNVWLQSEGHCDNIMSSSFKEMGAAKVGSYWTLDFGAQ